MSYFEQTAIAPPKRRSASVLAIICLLFLGAVVGVLASQGTFWFLRGGADSAEVVGGYRRGDAFHARKAKFTASFPSRPDRVVTKIPVGDIKLRLIEYVSYPTPDSTVAVGFHKVPKGVPFDLAAAIPGSLAGTDGEVVSQSKARHQGYPAVMGLTRSSIGLETRLLVVAKDRRLYYLMASASDDPRRAFDRLVDSFKMH